MHILSIALCAIFQVDDMGRRRVWAVMKSGERWEGDILVGADGIHSKASVAANRPCMPVAPEHMLMSGGVDNIGILWHSNSLNPLIPEQCISMQFP